MTQTVWRNHYFVTRRKIQRYSARRRELILSILQVSGTIRDVMQNDVPNEQESSKVGVDSAFKIREVFLVKILDRVTGALNANIV